MLNMPLHAVLNKDKDRNDWLPDIERSVNEYNAWYRKNAPAMYAVARSSAKKAVVSAFKVTEGFRNLSLETLTEHPTIISVCRQAAAPPMARDRLVTLADVSKNLVSRMEAGAFPKNLDDVEDQTQLLATTLTGTIDFELMPWIRESRAPRSSEKSAALAVLSDRVARAQADPEIRNSQERRQKSLLASFLEDRGFGLSTAPNWEMSPKSYVMGRNVPVKKETGNEVNLPVDCVVSPKLGKRLLCIELKSAGDFTNVNKRRKEEATKHDDLVRTYGTKVMMLLQLFGYFDVGYLSYEAGAGIDWAWDHRLEDFDHYFSK